MSNYSVIFLIFVAIYITFRLLNRKTKPKNIFLNSDMRHLIKLLDGNKNAAIRLVDGEMMRNEELTQEQAAHIALRRLIKDRS